MLVPMLGRYPLPSGPGPLSGGDESAGYHPLPARPARCVSPVRRRAGSGRIVAACACAVLAATIAGLALSSSGARAAEEGRPPAVQDPPSVLASGGAAPGEVSETPAAVERAAPSAAGEPGRQADGTGQAAAGLPGRQSPPPAAAPALSDEGPAVGTYEPAILRTFECPREAIARMIGSAVAEGEFSEALELEREVLVLCRDRQAILKELVSSEIELAAALQKSAAARAKEALALETARREADAQIEAAREAILAAARAEEARRDAAAARAASAAAAPANPVEAQKEVPDYGWYAVMGSGDDLRAAVTDGISMWRVRAGDWLPGGVKVVAVEARPPGVSVSGWSSDRLPYRSRPGR